MESLAGIRLPIEHRFDNWGLVGDIGDGLLDDEFADRIAQVVRSLIEQATPIVDDWENETDSLEI